MTCGSREGGVVGTIADRLRFALARLKKAESTDGDYRATRKAIEEFPDPDALEELCGEAWARAGQAVYDEIVDDCGHTMAIAAAHAVKTVQRASLAKLEEKP